MPTVSEPIFILTSDQQVNLLMDRILKALGYSTSVFQDWASANNQIKFFAPALVILGEKLNDADGMDTARELNLQLPATPILMLFTKETPELLKQAMRLGMTHYLHLPLRVEDILTAVQESLVQAKRRKEWTVLQAKRSTSTLERKIDELETLTRLGRAITCSLDNDSVLAAIVDAAVELTNAEEGSLLMVDEATGELFIRAARNFSEEFVQTFRVPIHDTLAGKVVSSGEPTVLDEKTPTKIKTSYLVHSLIYVPLKSKDKVIGVLGVDNRTTKVPFRDHDVRLLSALAEYALIALDNSRLFDNSNQKRNEMETILRNIQDGVIVIDEEHKVLFANPVILNAYQLGENSVIGQPIEQVFGLPDLMALVNSINPPQQNRVELTTPDGRYFNAMISIIPGIGQAITVHDITNLKKLDRLKSEFVNTVSHDLRSPLTAILGYTELVERAGPMNNLQRDFLHRVQNSVQSITGLVNDLLNLGQIEAGFDMHREQVYFKQLIEFSLESFKIQIAEREIIVKKNIAEELPSLFANPVQMRQMLDNLLDNAIKYTPKGGNILVQAAVQHNQIFMQVKDSGKGIPLADLPFIFDKFFRAGNVEKGTVGTGLGLAIVKSIVEAHQGRVWVDSTLSEGTTFTIVFPLTENI
jgi:signal transduction histidine kinase/DNA-binding response OmpR family regulator